MSHDDARSAARPASLPHELVHRLRNDLGVAIATADLLILDSTLGLQAVRDVVKIRTACEKAMNEINKAA